MGEHRAGQRGRGWPNAEGRREVWCSRASEGQASKAAAPRGRAAATQARPAPVGEDEAIAVLGPRERGTQRSPTAKPSAPPAAFLAVEPQ